MRKEYNKMIPLFKVFMNPEIENDIVPVLKSGMITQGQKVEEFEKKLQEYFKYPYILTLNSATSGLTMALRMMNLPPNSEVLICPLTCFATTSAILANGLRIKWVDVDPSTCNIDLYDLRKKITKSTKAICFVHWGGNPVDMYKLDKIKQYTREHFGFEIKILEDCAHAFGAKYKDEFIGTFGNYAVFSTQAIKHLTTGDGGLIFCPDKESYDRAKLLRWYGISREKRGDERLEDDIFESGYKFHMNDIAATIGLSNLPFMEQNLDKMRENTKILNSRLKDVKGVSLVKSNMYSACWLYSLRVKNKKEFQEYMKSKGVYVSQVHQRNDINTCVRQFYKELPNLDKLEAELVCIPSGWWVTKDQIIKIVGHIKQFYNTHEIKETVVEPRIIDKCDGTKLIIGGWGGTGTRTLVEILKQKGFQVPDNSSSNINGDYLGTRFSDELFFDAYHDGDFEELFSQMRSDLMDHEKCVIKHGHLILKFKEILQNIPNVKFIACIRDPCDMIQLRDQNYKNYGIAESSAPPLGVRLSIIKQWYDNLYHINSDNFFLFRVEDVINEPKETCEKLFEFLGCDNNVPLSIMNIASHITDFCPQHSQGEDFIKKHSQYNDKLWEEIQKFREEYNYINK